jgi:microcystin-dependent protein
MANLTESNTFDANVVQLDTTTPALGGPGGPMNAQAQSLANRTKNLNTRLTSVEADYPLGAQAPGGTTGQVLTKASNSPGDVVWSNVSGGGGGGVATVVVEEQTLAAAQTTITLVTATTSNMALYIEGAREFTYTIVGATQITLDRSYPAGTKVAIVQNDALGINLYGRKDQANVWTQQQTVPDGTASGHAVNKGQVDNAVATATAGIVGKLVGEVFMHAGTPAGSGGVEYIACDGRRLDRTLYATLFTALGGVGSPWGLPDASGFNIPDLLGRAPIGAGSGSGLTARAVAAKGGAETHTLAVGELPQHYHRISNSGESGSTGSGLAGSSIGQTSFNATTGGVSATLNGGAATVDGAHNNMQPFTAISMFIRAK